MPDILVDAEIVGVVKVRPTVRMIALPPMCAFLLSGCVGLGIHAARKIIQGPDKTEAERIASAEAAAIDKADAAGTLDAQTISWRDDQSDASGTLSAPTDGTHPGCKVFRQSLNLGGQITQGSLTACKQADGFWKVPVTSSRRQTTSGGLLGRS